MSTSLPDQLEIQPIEPFDVRLRVPGSKSLTNRALLLAALADGQSTLRDPLLADDTRHMLKAVADLGFAVDHDTDNRLVKVAGQGGTIPAVEAQLHLGNAGTATRFLTAACCLKSSKPEAAAYVIDGIPRMRERPIGELVDALRELGAKIEYTGNVGFPPLHIHGTGLRGGELTMEPTLSSQYISALLQIGPVCQDGLTLRFNGPVTSQPYVEMTVRLMQRFGANVRVDDDFTSITVGPGGYKGIDYPIEPDASNASYFQAAAAVVPGSKCVIEGLGTASIQGDVGFARVLEQMGATVEMTHDTIAVQGPADGKLHGVDVDLNRMPDMAQTLAVVAIFADGPTTIRDVGNLRVKETDRMAAIQNELTKLGATVLIHGDDLCIMPPKNGVVQPAAIDTYDDHRMAMSFSVVGLRVPGVVINDPSCVNKTFPDYFDYLSRLQPAAEAAE